MAKRKTDDGASAGDNGAAAKSGAQSSAPSSKSPGKSRTAKSGNGTAGPASATATSGATGAAAAGAAVAGAGAASATATAGGASAGSAAANAESARLALQRVYIKDLSFESPLAPNVFREEWKPTVNVDLRTGSAKIDDNNFEVVLTLTITTKLGEQVAYIAEVQQAGIFLMQGLEGDALRQVLATMCPNTLFPYAREALDNLVTKGTFPALMLAQVSFEALYQQAMLKAREQAAAGAGAQDDKKKD